MSDSAADDDAAAAARATAARAATSINKGEFLARNPGQVMSDANLCMLQLEPRQIHDRLAARWGLQVTPVTLMAAINLSLAFGSEYSGLAGQSSVWKTIFMSFSVSGFVLNCFAANHFVQQVADLGRVPDNRMHDWIKEGEFGGADLLQLFGMIVTFTQVGMAFWAMQKDLVVMGVLFGSIGLAIGTVQPFNKAKNKFKLYEYQVGVTD